MADRWRPERATSSRTPGAAPGIPSIDAMKAGRPGPVVNAEPRVPKFEVPALYPLSERGALRAFATVKFGNYLIVRGFRIVREDGRAAWVGLPCEVKEEPDPDRPERTRRKYFPTIELPDNWKRAIEEVVLSTFLAYESDGVLPQATTYGRREIRQ